jgi:hypothetical protein
MSVGVAGREDQGALGPRDEVEPFARAAFGENWKVPQHRNICLTSNSTCCPLETELRDSQQSWMIRKRCALSC